MSRGGLQPRSYHGPGSAYGHDSIRDSICMGLIRRLLSLACVLWMGHNEGEGWRSGIETRDGRELVLIRCKRCGLGLQWRMEQRISLVPDILVIDG